MAPPYRTVLCPTDLSPVGDRAVAVAFALAAPGGAVHLLHVNEPAVVVSPIDGSYLATYGYRPEAQEAVEKKVHAHLRRLVPDEALAHGTRTEIRVLHDPSVADQIAAEARRLQADVIVMGTHGRTGFGRILMGSVATDLLKKDTPPVVLVHDRGAR
jgi:nucleotide-binding universal stress UspA family protein